MVLFKNQINKLQLLQYGPRALFVPHVIITELVPLTKPMDRLLLNRN